MFLGIDVGTSSVKALLVDEQDAVVAQESVPLSVSRLYPLWAEQDPESWWKATIAAVQGLPLNLRKAVTAVGLTGQMHGATLLDKSDEPLRPAILWNDGRSAVECEELEQVEPRARSITGNMVMTGFTAPKLVWVRKHEPEVFKQTATVLLPKDYVRLKMTGEKFSDMSDAAGTSWLDVAKRDWSDEMLAATGLSRSHMPKLVEGTAAAGTLTKEVAELLGLPVVVVAGGGGDNAASAVGMGVVTPGQAFLSLGTSGVLFVTTDKFRPNPDKAAHAFCHCIPNRWHQMAVLLSAASALDWVVGVTNSNHKQLVAAAEKTGVRKQSPIFLPYLSGERTPHNNPFSRGVFFGLSSDSSTGDLGHATLEGVAFAFADGLDVLLESGGTIEEISMTGGGARFPYWGTVLASVLNRSVTYRRGGEVGGAFGAARLGRLALTGESPDKLCVAPPLVNVVEPDRKLVEVFAARRPIFAHLYRDLESSFKEFAQ